MGLETSPAVMGLETSPAVMGLETSPAVTGLAAFRPVDSGERPESKRRRPDLRRRRDERLFLRGRSPPIDERAGCLGGGRGGGDRPGRRRGPACRGARALGGAGPVRRADLPGRVPAVPGSADDRPVYPPVVRRDARGVDHVHGVLPGAAAGRVRLCAPEHLPPAPADAGDPARRAAAGVPGLPADHPQRAAQADGRRVGAAADRPAAGGDDRLPVPAAVGDQPASTACGSTRGGSSPAACCCSWRCCGAGGA